MSENKKPSLKNISSKNVMPSKLELETLIDYYKKGLFTNAEKLARSITQEFPNHEFAWIVLGVLLNTSGRFSEALTATQKAFKLAPQNPQIHLNMGIILKGLGRLNEAEKAYRQVITLKPNFAEAHNNLGNTLEELGQFENAEVSYKQAITLKPNFAEAHNNLGVTYEKTGRLNDAKASYKRAIDVMPSYAEAYNNLGNTLKELGEFENAEESYKQAIIKKPNYLEAYNNLGSFYREGGDYKKAINYFDLMKNDVGTALSLECLYISENFSEFNERLISLSKKENMNLRVAALSCLASYQKGKKDPYPFCPNPLDFIKTDNLRNYDLYSKNLFDEIIKETDQYHMTWESRTTKFGFQSPSDVFENPSKNLSDLENIVREAINSYYNQFKSETNLFIKNWPSKYKLQGWYNRLVKNGHHTSHIHQTGSLSGVIYLKTIDLPQNNEGAIEFGLHGYDLPITDNKYPKKLHRPKKGDLVLFPSSLFHRTIPFTTDTERCVIAFDLKAI